MNRSLTRQVETEADPLLLAWARLAGVGRAFPPEKWQDRPCGGGEKPSSEENSPENLYLKTWLMDDYCLLDLIGTYWGYKLLLSQSW